MSKCLNNVDSKPLLQQRTNLVEPNQVSKEDWEEWYANPITIAFFKAVKQEQELAVLFAVKSEDLDANKQARLIGIMAGIQKVLDIQYDDREQSNN